MLNITVDLQDTNAIFRPIAFDISKSEIALSIFSRLQIYRNAYHDDIVKENY